MNRKATWCFRGILSAAAAVLLAGGAARADVYDDIVKLDWDQGRKVPSTIEEEIRQATTPAARQAIEAKLLKALDNGETTYAGKQFVCRMLRRIGSAAAVPALARLLADPKLSHMARLALQYLPAPQAGEALLAAVGKLDGNLRIGAVTSLGERREARAVGALARLAAASDAALAQAAIRALGRIATAEAGQALAAVQPPAELRTVWADASLCCADRALAGGQADVAARTYRTMFAKGNPKMIRIAALRGVVLSEKDKAAGDLLALMKDDDADLRAAASKFVVEMPGQTATKVFAAALGSMKPDEQVVLIGALTARGDAAAGPEVARLVGSDAEPVRIAAIEALAVLGDASSVPMLAKAAAAGGPAGQAAIHSLNQLQGEGVGEAMAKLLDSPDPAFRAGILGVVEARADRTVMPAVLKAARDQDANVRKAAIRALTVVAGEKELGDVVALLLAGGDESQRAALDRALSAAALRCDGLAARTAPIIAGLSRADAGAKVHLVAVLGRLGGPDALAAVRKQLAASDADVATEAVRALAAWPDASGADDLLAVIKTTKNNVHKVLAFRGYVRMANMPGQRSGADTGAMYRQAMQLAASTAEKKSVLAGLANARSAEALKLVEPLLAEPAMKAEAELAYVQIAGNVRDVADVEARAALRKVIAATASAAVRQRAQETLNEMDKYRGYITSWMGCGPYTQGSPFATAYPPEKEDAAGIQWKLLDKGVGPQAIDLTQAFATSANGAVYMKANVFSPADQGVLLEMGSDDGIKVWVNGKLVHSNDASRPCRPGEDKAKASLRKGWNAVLVKITQGGGDWAFCVRLCQPSGAALEGMKVSVESR